MLETLNLTEYIVPVVCLICLCIGYILKKWFKDVENKIIPTALALVGLILTVWMNGWTFSPSIMLSGLLSGLSATGLHQAFKQYIEKEGDA